MTLEERKSLPPPQEHEFLEDEVFLDEYHPDNQDYLKDLKQIKRLIVQQSMTMKPWHVEATKLKNQGLTHKEIAEKVQKSVGGVQDMLKTPQSMKLRQMLQYHQVALDGPNEAHRKRMLWEIALDNQEAEPKTSISALVEMNRMDGTYDNDAKNKDIKIVINNQLFPKGALDG